MGKTSRRTKAKHKDFQKVKFKVGKKLPKGQNVTNTAFKSTSLTITQHLDSSNKNQPITNRRLGLNELMVHLKHYSASVRHDGLTGLRELLTTAPYLIEKHLNEIIGSVCELFVDKDAVIRKSLLRLFKQIFPNTKSEHIQPFFPILNAHLCCAMTHINDDIKVDSLGILDLCLEFFPQQVISNSSTLLANFLEQISNISLKHGHQKSERTLVVDPKSKLASNRGRQKVLQRLLKLLEAIVSNFGCRREEDLSARHVFDCSPDGVGVLSSCRVSSTWMQLPSFRDKTGSAIKGTTEEPEELKKFIQTILPLLLQCWAEVSPGHVLVECGDNTLTNECIATLNSILSIIQLLGNCVEHRSLESDDISMIWFSGVALESLLQDLMPYFPFSLEDSLSAHSKHTKKSSYESVVSIQGLNLKFCDILTQLSYGCAGEMPWLERISGYILQHGRTSVDQVTAVLSVIGRLAVLYKETDQSEALLPCVIRLYGGLSHHSKHQREVLRLIEKLVVKENQFSSSVIDWLTSLPRALMKVIGHDLESSEVILHMIKMTFPRLPQPSQQRIQETFSSLLGSVTSLSDEAQRLLLTSLCSLESLSDCIWPPLTQCCRNINPTIVCNIIHLLQYRYLKSSERGFCIFSQSQYISFLISLMIGYSQEDMSVLNKTDYEEMLTGRHYRLVLCDLDLWKRQESIVLEAVRAFGLFTNDTQVATVVCSTFSVVLDKYVALPILTASSILQSVAFLSRNVASRLDLSVSMQRSVADLCWDVSMVTSTLDGVHLDEDLHSKLVEWIIEIFTLHPNILKLYMEGLAENMEGFTSSQVLTTLTQIVQSPSLRAHLKDFSSLLEELCLKLQETFGERHLQWEALRIRVENLRSS